MKIKWIILIVIALTLSLVACNVFDDDNYVWDDWAIALFKN